jgi:predicted helicase
MQLQQTGYKFDSNQRLGIYLTNTLEEAAKKSEKLFAKWISDEANAAAHIKVVDPILVVLGNPPYSGHSANRSWVEVKVTKGQQYVGDFGLEQGRVTEIKKKAASDGVVEVPTFIGHLMQDYYVVDGAWLDERNPKWLQDDYVKFIRFGQWRIDRTGEGIVAFVTNHGYLDNPTFRGMRQNLMGSFNEIYVYDLHGSAKKLERAPDGGRDENVFDIQQGVAICLCVKKKGDTSPAKIFHADLWGEREVKYKRLVETDASETKWKKLEPTKPFYLFAPQDVDLRAEYEKAWKITEIMAVNVLGFQTHRDDFAIDFDRQILRKRISELHDENLDDAEIRSKFDLGEWNIKKARKELRDLVNWEKALVPCLYRPFDIRFCYLSSIVMDRPRPELMQHVVGKSNLCLGLGRQGIAVNDPQWSLVSISRHPVDANIFRRGGINIFPLYLYDAETETKRRGGGTMLMALFESSPGYSVRRANLNPKFIADLTQRLGLKWLPVDCGDLKKTVGPEDFFNYAYAVFHSPAYRERYTEFLKIDFPRLPLTSDLKLFRLLVAKGAELVALHLMESSKLDKFITEFNVKGSNEVEKVQYTDNDQRVWINPKQFFDGVPKAVWEFHVGGYQVCEKWLKDRKDRKLTYEDIQHYQKTVVALNKTIRLMTEIDEAIPKWPIE